MFVPTVLVGLLPMALKWWRLALWGGAVLAVLIVLGMVHRHGTTTERAKWELRVAQQVEILTKQYRDAASRAAERARDSEQRNKELEGRVKDVLAEMQKLPKAPGSCDIPASVTDRLRRLR